MPRIPNIPLPNRATNKFTMMLTDEEFEMLKELATRDNKNRSEYLRSLIRVLGRENRNSKVTKVDIDLVMNTLKLIDK